MPFSAVTRDSRSPCQSIEGIWTNDSLFLPFFMMRWSRCTPADGLLRQQGNGPFE
jgi:hypothetical protein